MNKEELRRVLKRRRRELTAAQVAQSSTRVVQHILACDAYRKAQRIMGYLAFSRELNIDAVLQAALNEGKQVYVPQIISATEMRPVRLYKLEQLVLDQYGIRSVAPPVEPISPEELDLVLIPGLAFDRQGGRMGMGAGYYDRFLPHTRQAAWLGIAYDQLLQASLPQDAYDVPVPQLVTESGIINISWQHNINKGE